MKFPDMLRTWFTDAEIVFDDGVQSFEHFINHEEQEVEAMITDALNALAAAKDAVLAKIANDGQALTQAQADRDAANAALATAQAQLADAENQINAITAQLNPPA